MKRSLNAEHAFRARYPGCRSTDRRGEAIAAAEAVVHGGLLLPFRNSRVRRRVVRGWGC